MALVSQERAHYWRHPGVPEVELLDATFVRHAFGRHTHPTYTIGLIEAGIEEYEFRGENIRVGAGGLALLDPEEVHTGHAGVPEGWTYRVLYPDVAMMESVARDLGGSGPPSFTVTATDDAEGARRVRAAHQAAQTGDRLSTSALLRHAMEHIISRYAGDPGHGAARSTPPLAIVEARDLLHERFLDPPRLEELARLVGASPYALNRAFSAAYGLPPHAYLNQVRLHRAQRLLRTGIGPADVAVRVGFADQAHLTRHFKRHKGVPPGAYQRGVSE